MRGIRRSWLCCRRHPGRVRPADRLHRRGGSGDLVIGICAECDAPPGIGHACGRNVDAVAVFAALALASVADEIGVTAKVLGTPAEDSGRGLRQRQGGHAARRGLRRHRCRDDGARVPFGLVWQELAVCQQSAHRLHGPPPTRQPCRTADHIVSPLGRCRVVRQARPARVSLGAVELDHGADSPVQDAFVCSGCGIAD